MPRRTVVVVLALVVLTVALGAGGALWASRAFDDGTTDHHGAGRGHGGSDGTDLSWDGCGDGMSCASLEVPLDHDDPDGRTIELAVARRPATGDPGQRLGILVLNPGGPGAGGVDFLTTAPLVGDLVGLNERFDLVAWDPRGVGESTPLTCDEEAIARFRRLDPDPDDDAEQEALDAAARAVAESCADEDAELAAHLGTDQTVEDIDALRAALGEEQLSWLGFSYGTLLGQRYAEAHPERVRAMVLDGVVDPSVGLEGLLTAQAAGFEDFLEGTVPDGAYEAASARLEEQPIRDGRGTVGPAELAVGTFMAAYDPALANRLAGILDDAADGDGAALGILARTYRSAGAYPAYVGTLCADSPFPRTPGDAEALAEEVAEEAPRTGAAIVNEILPCTWWVATAPPPPAPVTAPDTPTILVIGNRGDVATPLAQAEAVAGQLDDAVLIVHEGEGHASYGSNRCVQELVATYLVELVAPPDVTTCTD